jgi:tRNAThr (cytosine32-N3)-methyltransferase
MPAISFGIANGSVHLILWCLSINFGFRLHNEFPELIAATKADAGPISIAEVGCGMALSPVHHPDHFPQPISGAGNSVFPLLTANQNPDLHLRAYDYSHHAVKLVQVIEHSQDHDLSS